MKADPVLWKEFVLVCNSAVGGWWEDGWVEGMGPASQVSTDRLERVYDLCYIGHNIQITFVAVD